MASVLASPLQIDEAQRLGFDFRRGKGNGTAVAFPAVADTRFKGGRRIRSGNRTDTTDHLSGATS